MAKKRFTDIEIWDKEWYMELKPTYKCLIKYIFDKCDASGCWKPNWKLASLHINDNVCADDLKKIPKDQYEILPNGKIFIPDFIDFQYGTLSKKSPAHNPIFLAIEKNSLHDRVFNRVSNTLKEKDKDKEEEMEVDKEEEEIKKEEEIFIVPEMQKIWKKEKPDYPDDISKDYTAIRCISEFICNQSGIKFPVKNKDDTDSVLRLWGVMSEFISNHKFFKNYSLFQVEKHIQSITQEIKNEESGSKNGKAGAGKINGKQLNEAFTKFYSVQQ